MDPSKEQWKGILSVIQVSQYGKYDKQLSSTTVKATIVSGLCVYVCVRVCRRRGYFHSLIQPIKALPLVIWMEMLGQWGSLQREEWNSSLPYRSQRTLASIVSGLCAFFAPGYMRSLFPTDERAGLLCCVLNDPAVAVAVKTQLKPICRRMWSNPPNHGCRIVATALTNPSLYQEWSVILVIILKLSCYKFVVVSVFLF